MHSFGICPVFGMSALDYMPISVFLNSDHYFSQVLQPSHIPCNTSHLEQSHHWIPCAAFLFLPYHLQPISIYRRSGFLLVVSSFKNAYPDSHDHLFEFPPPTLAVNDKTPALTATLSPLTHLATAPGQRCRRELPLWVATLIRHSACEYISWYPVLSFRVALKEFKGYDYDFKYWLRA